MTTPVMPAPPAALPTAGAVPSDPAAGQEFASALDDAVAGGHGGPRGQEATADPDGSPTEPAQEQPGPDPAVSPAGMPPALWALLTGIGPGTPAPAVADAPVAATGDLALAAAVPAAAGPAAPVVAGPVVAARVDVLGPPAVPGAAAVDGTAPARTDAALPTVPAGATTAAGTPGADPLPGFAVVVAAPDTQAAPAADHVPGALPPASAPAVASPAPPEGAGTDTGSASDQGTPAPAPAPSAAMTPAAVAPTLATAVPEPAAPAAQATSVSGQVAQQVAVLRNGPDGTHTMTVVLTPETLGPVEVQVTMTQGAVELSLKTATEAGRVALLEALPDLRRELAGAGVSCTNASVDRESGSAWTTAQQHAGGDRTGQQGRPGGQGSPWQRTSDLGEGRPALTSLSSASTGVDVRV